MKWGGSTDAAGLKTERHFTVEGPYGTKNEP